MNDEKFKNNDNVIELKKPKWTLMNLLTTKLLKSLFSNRIIETIGILFSGGIDSLLLTGLVSKIAHKNTKIELINVAFKHSNSLAHDRVTALNALFELRFFSLYKLI